MVRCRFAPSPTGYLHIGNVRTAIFNYLYARNQGGKFLLRIEDTDKERSTKEAIDVIFQGLSLLGLNYDEDVVYQSSNENRHKEVAHYMLENGKAYKCFHTTEELAEMRKTNRSFKSSWRNVDAGDHPSDKPYVIRIKSPDSGESTIDDMVQGTVTVKNTELDDMVILRSDGSPVYQLAVVVDDFDSKITHVIRGDDHLTNTFRQNMIYDAMGWTKPTYAHLPLIMDENGKKVSKRTGAASIVDFVNLGYLPESILNYLAKLGWSNDKEFMTIQDMITDFSFANVGKSASRMDYKKLNFINSHWIMNSEDSYIEEYFYKIQPHTSFKDLVYPKDIINLLIPSLKVRSKTIIEMLDMTKYLDKSWYDSNKIDIPERVLNVGNTDIKEKFIIMVDNFVDNDQLMNQLKEFSETNSLKLKDVAAFIRYKLCKDKISPPLDVVIKSLNIEELKRRINE